MTFRVEISAAAERDADSILEWLISEHAGETGLRWFLGMQETILSLAQLPHRMPDRPGERQVPV